MSLSRIDAAARQFGLALRGAFHPAPDDNAPKDCLTLVMIGPDEPGFWTEFTASPEYRDGAPHPLDRWSRRTLEILAADFDARVVFPYDGPPYAPFLDWATRTSEAWPSPTGLLVHETAGLFLSYRGALALPMRLDLRDDPPRNPCPDCARPCTTACPVGALADGRAYDVPACRAHVASPEGRACRAGGCLVRRACPVSQRFGRLPEQSAFHMAAFMPE